ncbi:MFS transporter [Ferruginibacter sp. SUN106]|uniref:MFS transporter n=1 Tax=Ferruginibacter sp. SUN106 TaxID=2978348 RepID=UPI003D36DB35
MTKKQYGLLSLPVIVAALGFFVDIFDLLLFGVVRKSSFAELGTGLSSAEVLSKGELTISIQLIGMVVGGIIWGIIGDKFGRLKVLFGSILLYSIANIANGFVHDINWYMVIRFIAGVGLAGELGAGITLTSEILPKEKRGLAGTIIATCGVLGGITAALLSKVITDWRTLYFIGGGIGLVLLALRVSVAESTMFSSLEKSTVQRGNYLQFFNNKSRFYRYAKGILIGMPVWYCIGILIFFADEFAKRMGITGITPGNAILFQYIGLGFGDVAAGLISHQLKSRKKALYIFYSVFIVFMILFFTQQNSSAAWFYFICSGLGFGSGISVLYIISSAEQFGTNLRASAATSITNFVRGFTPLLLLIFTLTRGDKGEHYLKAAGFIGIGVMLIAVSALYFTKETYGKDLDFVEE